ncbi:hypothetical protein BJX66DRAFT_318567 [Aspergillus keveii]|uniref:Uncharacterized protein n=1 Tax=Aspergillus keveii TaxID=714993 RepID=A0ABR4FK29_9EURO
MSKIALEGGVLDMLFAMWSYPETSTVLSRVVPSTVPMSEWCIAESPETLLVLVLVFAIFSIDHCTSTVGCANVMIKGSMASLSMKEKSSPTSLAAPFEVLS